MAILNIAPTKSGLLTLKRQLAVAEEGYDLLEQKRQILVFELMKRLKQARIVERQVGRILSPAFASLKEAMMDTGAAALDRAALAADLNHEVTIGSVHLMGLRLPRVTAKIMPPGLPFGVGGTSANTDMAMKRFGELLPLLAELAELETAILRLAIELRRTQRRCNALSKILIPNTRQTITFIASTLEERERESFVIVRMIRDRLTSPE
jgi:V/A-type H+-transporting ATPase subunit D